jgi:hypothetical protein
MIFINDPVSGFNYTLDPRARTARKLALPPFAQRFESATPLPGGGGGDVFVYGTAPTRAAPTREQKQLDPARKPKVESLGRHMIEGVEAEGTRTIITIPAGEIGNERPIEIVNEKWYSPELQTVVMTKRIDPLVGETTYKLTNINRGEPARSLFEVPADYKIKELTLTSLPVPGIRRARKPSEQE